MLVGDRGLVLQIPHQCVDEVGVFDENGHLFEHMLEANVGLLQAVKDRTGETEAGEQRLSFNVSFPKINVIITC